MWQQGKIHLSISQIKDLLFTIIKVRYYQEYNMEIDIFVKILSQSLFYVA
jgi:hypothetical protein